jgi:hypothetical protein
MGSLVRSQRGTRHCKEELIAFATVFGKAQSSDESKSGNQPFSNAKLTLRDIGGSAKT